MISRHYHHSVLLAGMDIISRYQVLLVPLQQIHYQCLSVFMNGLNSNKSRVREKAVNLLSRFVAALREGIVPYQQGILQAVQVFLYNQYSLANDCCSYTSRLYAF